jgi:hypothetical protein
MIVAWTREYNILKGFAQFNNLPARNLLIISGIFAFSYIVRTILNFVAFFDSKSLTKLQKNSCDNKSDGWALLVFFTHFLGEVLPLFFIFCVQRTMT